jgi:hypothetical protein
MNYQTDAVMIKLLGQKAATPKACIARWKRHSQTGPNSPVSVGPGPPARMGPGSFLYLNKNEMMDLGIRRRQLEAVPSLCNCHKQGLVLSQLNPDVNKSIVSVVNS